MTRSMIALGMLSFAVGFTSTAVLVTYLLRGVA